MIVWRVDVCGRNAGSQSLFDYVTVGAESGAEV
jgi:hypothetical protein